MELYVSTAEVTSSIGVVKYANVAWESVKAVEGHPLAFLLNQGIPVYYKVNREICFAYRHRWMPLGGRRTEEIHALAAKPVEFSTMGAEERLLLLQLDDDDLTEILITGSRVVTTFSLGGLGVTQSDTGDGALGLELTDIDFHRCYLVNRRRWKYAQDTARFPVLPRQEDYAEPIEIGFEDLYLETSDVSALVNLRRGVGVEREPYPFSMDDRVLPTPINWAFQAAFAIYRDREADANEVGIKAWLRTNSPNKIFQKRWVRTGASLILRDYKFSHRFDESVLGQFRMAEALQALDLSRQLTCALAVTEWWMDQDKTDRASKRVELAGLLEDIGFQKFAVIDLTGMISGEVIADEEAEHFGEALDHWQKKKRRASYRRPNEYGSRELGQDVAKSLARAVASAEAPVDLEDHTDLDGVNRLLPTTPGLRL